MFGSSVIGRGVESCLRAGGGRLVTEEVWITFNFWQRNISNFVSGVDGLGRQGAPRAGLVDHRL